jgi:uncharacterized protein
MPTDMTTSDAARFEDIVRTTPWLVRALEAARDVDAPDWLLSAGALRSAVWDRLHGFPDRLPADVDVGFFDPGDLGAGSDAAVEAALRARAPELPWDAKNQAAPGHGHLAVIVSAARYRRATSR